MPTVRKPAGRLAKMIDSHETVVDGRLVQVIPAGASVRIVRERSSEVIVAYAGSRYLVKAEYVQFARKR